MRSVREPNGTVAWIFDEATHPLGIRKVAEATIAAPKADVSEHKVASIKAPDKVHKKK